jgi:Rad3-related DNA helicase
MQVSDIDYSIVLEGRADGIICDLKEDEDGEKRPLTDVVIDEIKTTQKDVEKMTEPVYVHKAQACVYAYIFLSHHKLEKITVQMTYCNPDTEKIKKFTEEYDRQKITEWFDNLIAEWKMWSDFVFLERRTRTASIQKLEFPFEYRKGQKKLVAGVYNAVKLERNLFIQASTGVGKTISTIYPSVQSMGLGLADKIFYLTSKTITRTVAENTFDILRKNGLHIRTVTLTAKDKICILDERDCNPDKCVRAKGHFDRINKAVYDMITNENVIDRDVICKYAAQYEVCPYEMSLDAAYWCDCIVCDYNYVFDPNVALKRFFGNGGRGDYIFLIDEAHNLVDRARQMYSAVLVKEDFLEVKRIVKGHDRALYNSLEKCNAKLLEYKHQCDTINVLSGLGTFPAALERCYGRLQKFLEQHRDFKNREEVLQLFFQIHHFLNMYDCMDEKYIVYTDYGSQGSFFIKLMCVDPSGNLSLRLSQGRSAVFFSATLLPVSYFKEMLTGNSDDYAIYAQSTFDSGRRRILIGSDVSSRYTRRNEYEYKKVCSYIAQTVHARQGKYMVFFPSYQYMEEARHIFTQDYGIRELDMDKELHLDRQSEETFLAVQSFGMAEDKKEAFLSLFNEDSLKGSLVGFCVLGGMFSEGIDLQRDSLIGAVIVGTGIPMITKERNLLRQYFDDCKKDGYAYAYVYPGMNKVLQSAGRVIRTDLDSGVIVLLDDRFLTPEYEKLFPREWDCVYPVTQKNFKNILLDFWQNLVQL